MKTTKIVRAVSMVGLITESVLLSSANAFTAPLNIYKITETSITQMDLAAEDASGKEAVAEFRINTATELRNAFQEQSVDLNDVFFLSIHSSIDIHKVLQERDMGFVFCQWKFQQPVGNDGNKVDAEYILYMFTVEYRDDIRVLQAYRNKDLIHKLTANEMAMMAKAEGIIRSIIKPDMSDYDKVLAIHDYLVLNSKYTTQSDVSSVQASIHKAEGILLYGKGVCSSYAGSMCLLLGMVDVDCLYVTGIGQSKNGLSGVHAWNKIMIDGMWYNFDVTWDDPTPDKSGVVSYSYFGLSDKDFSVDHIWNTEVYPAGNSTYYSYYSYNNLLSRNYEQFKNIITQAIMEQKNNREINIRLYVENYDSNEYSLSFIFDLLSNVEKASHSRIVGTSGEFTLNIVKNDGAAPTAPYLNSASAWARAGINEAYSKGFIPSEIQNTYQLVITHQEFCKMAVQWIEYTTGKPIGMILSERGLTYNPNAFSDTTDSYVLAAYALGITNGTTAPTNASPGIFTPAGECSREQAEALIRNTCRAVGMDVGNNQFGSLAVLTREQSIIAFNNIKAEG
jgi:hypothetical protein